MLRSRCARRRGAFGAIAAVAMVAMAAFGGTAAADTVGPDVFR
jgi:hypothetical protein